MISPNSTPEELLSHGEELYFKNDTTEALRYFTAAMEKATNNSERLRALNNVGVVTHSIGDNTTAIEMFHAAIALDPNDITAPLNLADIFAEQDDYTKSLLVLQTALSHNHNNSELLESLTMIQEQFSRKTTPSDESVLSILERMKSRALAAKPLRKLHIGGTQIHPQWEILNANDRPGVDHVGKAQDLSRFKDNTFSEIYASHVVEHIDYKHLKGVLFEWNRVMIPGGIISIGVPDLTILSGMLTKPGITFDEELVIMRMIFGGHIDQWDYHLSGLTQNLLCWFLKEAGFVKIRRVPTFDIFNDTSSLRVGGTLISLNLIAEKPTDSAQDKPAYEKDM